MTSSFALTLLPGRQMDSPVSLSPKMMTAMVRTNGVNGMAAVWESTAGVWYNKVKIPLCEVIAQIKEVTYVINRLNDFYVKYLLGNEKRKNLTIHFLNAVLYGDETPHITDVSFIDKDKEPKQADGKLVKLDILARTDTGMLIDIEVQIQRHPHLDERFLYYWAEMYGGQLRRGDEYSALKPAVSIVLMDFDYLPEESWHNVYHICNDVSKQVLTHHFAMHFIELKKFRYSDIKSLHRLGKWTAYFSNCSAEETEELAMSDPIMKEVVNAEMAFTEDEIMRRNHAAAVRAAGKSPAGLPQ